MGYNKDKDYSYTGVVDPSVIREDIIHPATIEDVYEPYLIKQGFMQRTSRGRIAQESAYKLLNKPKKNNNQKDLFND